MSNIGPKNGGKSLNVPKDTAQQGTTHWRECMAHYVEDPTKRLHGFFIHKSDLERALAVAEDAIGIRVYGALDGPLDFGSLHLYVVGVDGAGNDVLSIPATGETAVFDTTIPCPDLCGRKNWLNSDVEE